jgi:hypothetical protein
MSHALKLYFRNGISSLHRIAPFRGLDKILPKTASAENHVGAAALGCLEVTENCSGLADQARPELRTSAPNALLRHRRI